MTRSATYPEDTQEATSPITTSPIIAACRLARWSRPRTYSESQFFSIQLTFRPHSAILFIRGGEAEAAILGVLCQETVETEP